MRTGVGVLYGESKFFCNKKFRRIFADDRLGVGRLTDSQVSPPLQSYAGAPPLALTQRNQPLVIVSFRADQFECLIPVHQTASVAYSAFHPKSVKAYISLRQHNAAKLVDEIH